jgi:hypothetical protein
MKTSGPDDPRHDQAILAPYFAAARQGPPVPSRDLLSAILADAGEVSAARAAVAPPAPRSAPEPRRGLFAAFGGWRVATALAAASVIGFTIGLSGAVDVTGRVGLTAATADSQGDPVAGFFDLASAE